MVRRKYSTEFKLQIVQEALETGNHSLVARRHDIDHSLVGKWLRQYRDGRLNANKSESVETVTTGSEFRRLSAEAHALREENERLKKLLGEKDLEIAILRDLIKKAHPHVRIG